jgi:hypothetical protein
MRHQSWSFVIMSTERGRQVGDVVLHHGLPRSRGVTSKNNKRTIIINQHARDPARVRSCTRDLRRHMKESVPGHSSPSSGHQFVKDKMGLVFVKDKERSQWHPAL